MASRGEGAGPGLGSSCDPSAYQFDALLWLHFDGLKEAELPDTHVKSSDLSTQFTLYTYSPSEISSHSLHCSKIFLGSFLPTELEKP